MATVGDRLAASLKQLSELQRHGRRVFRSTELSRVHRERLLANGFLLEVMKGWLISTSPDADPGDTTPWFACFWEFCAEYATHRFGDEWHLSPEQSLLLHAETTVVPRQVVIHAPTGTNNIVRLPFGTSLFDLKTTRSPPVAELTVRDRVRLYTQEAALTKVSADFLARNPVEAQVVLSQVRDASDLLRHLLDAGRSQVAGRLVGALRRVDRPELADDISNSMRAVGYDIRETDPFEPHQTFAVRSGAVPPIVQRLQAMWEAGRESVPEVFPKAPGLPADHQAYLRSVDDSYRSDAYHSLSIEGYRVSPELVDRVRSGNWDPERSETDRQGRDALAARGYWQSFQRVRETVRNIITGGDAAALVRTAHRDWYRELFQPCVAAGLLPASALAGYRNDAVFLRGSRHMPPRSEVVRDAMPALFDLLAGEPEPSVRAVLGHWLVGYIHPYPDGNGRIARFLMNTMLASGGYPWTVIRVDDRDTYLTALENASVDADLRPFASFVAQQMQWSMRS